MGDPTDYIPNGVSALVGGGGGLAIMRIVLGSAFRGLTDKIDNVGKQLESLKTETSNSSTHLQASIEELKGSVNGLAQAHVGFSKDIGTLTQGLNNVTDRQNGMSAAWKTDFEKHEARLETMRKELNQRIDDLLVNPPATPRRKGGR